MTDEELSNITDTIVNKLGTENSAIISDDLASLITLNSGVVDSIAEKDKEIARLKENNEKLIMANGNLLKQVPKAKEPVASSQDPEENVNKNYNWFDSFDEYGNFKTKF